VAILIGAVLFAILGKNPAEAYSTIITGSLAKPSAIRQTVKIAVPLLGTSLALAPCFGMRYWNIGAEGQITAGALAATYFALHFGKTWPHPVILIVMALAACIFGGIWAAIPAFFKAKYNTNETLFTLMMNYIAIQLVSFFVYKWSVPKGSGQVGVINRATHAGWLPAIGKYDYLLNILIVAAITAFMYIYLKYSKHGYEISVVGESENTARYIGIPVKKVIIRTMLISGALCGIAGMLLVSGTDHTISRDTAAGRGFTAIMVSWLAKFNPVFMVLTSFLIVFLQKGATEISTAFALNESFSEIITGIIIFFIIGCEFFIQYTVRFREKEAAK
jgi:simple sugar transport system permease protein